MRKSVTFQIICTLLFIVTALQSCNQNVNITEDIGRMNAHFIKSYTSGEINKLINCYTKEARIFPQNRDVIQGHEDVINFWQEAFDRGIKHVELITISANLEGSVVLEEGRYKIFLEKGKEADNGKYICIWKKEHGEWKMHCAMWNTSHPASEYRLPDLLLH